MADTGLSPSQTHRWVASAGAASDAGIPTTFVFGGKQAVGSEGVIMERNPVDGLTSDGHGIDHAEDLYGEAVIGLVFGCGGSL